MTFETFWSLYPRRLNRKQAEKSYNTAIKKGATHAEIINGAAEYSAYCNRKQLENQYICHATTFLNQERFRNDYRADDASKPTKANNDKQRQSQTSMAISQAIKIAMENGAHVQCGDTMLDAPF